MKIKKSKFLLLILLTLTTLLYSSPSYAKEGNNKENGATNSSFDYDITTLKAVKSVTNTTDDKINKILTDRADSCVVGSNITNTTDSISSTVSEILETKEKNDVIEKEKEEIALRQKQLQEIQNDENYLLAAIIYCEARGESYDGQVAVGRVVLNRLNSNKFPNTIRDVIYQSGQFTPACNGTLDKVLLNKSVSQSCINAANAALNGENPIGDCLYFHIANDNSVGQILGNHVFY